MSSTELNEWAARNEPGDQMIWKGAALHQIAAFRGLADRMGGSCRVVETHTSKSIKLPVVEITGTHGRFLLRDNFHGWNLCCLWDFPPDLPYDEVYGARDWDWYLHQIERKRGYSFGGWTDEEMDDPRILRVQVTRENGTTYWKEVKGDEKDRWANRFVSTEWYTRDWSSGRILVDGPMGPGCKMYVTGHCFAEGISRVVDPDALKPYEKGKQSFALECRDANAALALMQMINAAPRLP